MVDQSIQRQDAEGSRALIDEHAGNLVYQIDRLLDIIADLEQENSNLSEQLSAAIDDWQKAKDDYESLLGVDQ